MPHAYIPILIFALLAAAFPVFCLVGSRRFGPATLEKIEAAEEARVEDSTTEAGREKPGTMASFIAALFVILSVEVVFLFAWAVKFAEMGGYGLILLLIFVGIPLAGYAWLYKKGVFDAI
ncbi:MAG TPA: NADH-quinone oxidoreductase subunit A [Candidatus Acidoferrales bacterium]